MSMREDNSNFSLSGRPDGQFVTNCSTSQWGDPLDHSCGVCFKFQFIALFRFTDVGAGVPDGPHSRHCEFAEVLV